MVKCAAELGNTFLAEPNQLTYFPIIKQFDLFIFICVQCQLCSGNVNSMEHGKEYLRVLLFSPRIGNLCSKL